MDHESGPATDDLGAADLRATIERTREELGTHLAELKESLLPSGRAEGPGTKGTMPNKKATRSKATRKSATRPHGRAGKPVPDTGPKAAARKRPASRKAGGAISKAGEVLDTMLAGAVAGAVAGAARELSEGPGAKGRGAAGTAKNGVVKKGARTAQVVGGMAPGAAIGAVVGAAKAVMPSEGGERTQGKRQPRAKTSKAAKKG